MGKNKDKSSYEGPQPTIIGTKEKIIIQKKPPNEKILYFKINEEKEFNDT